MILSPFGRFLLIILFIADTSNFSVQRVYTVEAEEEIRCVFDDHLKMIFDDN